MNPVRKIFIVSGEESGDRHGASLMEALGRLAPGISFRGMGGPRMHSLGLDGPDSSAVSVVGLTEVIGRLPAILKTFRELKRLLKSFDADAVVLIDFPDFNLRFAREARKLNVPVIYYISPQVWAWRPGRVSSIARLVDRMLVVFPFEAGLYERAGLPVEYVGHPLKETAVCDLTRDEARRLLGLPGGSTVVALLPGSRPGEVARILPPMAAAAAIVAKKTGPSTVFPIPVADAIDAAEVRLAAEGAAGAPLDFRPVSGKMYEILRASDACAVASGTATLEAALIRCPMVIVYKTSGLTYAMAKRLVRVDSIGLPNIVAGRKFIRELVQEEASPAAIASELLSILTEPDRKNDIMTGYGTVASRLTPGAANKAAAAIIGVAERARGEGRRKTR